MSVRDALQLAGAKQWTLYPSQTNACAGLDVDRDAESITVRTIPGDLLYIPHGWPHAATANDGASLHLTFTIAEPAPLDFAEGIAQEFQRTEQHLCEHHHLIGDLSDKAEVVRAALLRTLDGLDTDRVVESTLALMRRRVG